MKNSSKNPYNTDDFIKIVTNSPFEKKYDPIEILECHKKCFDFVDTFPGIFYFIHDFINYKYLFCSKSIKNVIGFDDSFFLGQTFNSVFKYLHPMDVQNIKATHEQIFNFLFSQPIEKKAKIRFDFNYRIIHSNGQYRHILQQSIFPCFKNDRPVYDFSTCTDITSISKSTDLHLAIFMQNDSNDYEEVYNSSINNLSSRENEIHSLVEKGSTTKEIADKLCLSIHTISTHRKNITKKISS